MDVTPKKLSNSEEFCFLCKASFSLPKSKIKVLGKSALDIPSLILKATKEDVNVYVEGERFYICRIKCYNRLVRYQNALRKVEEIGLEIQKDYQSDDSVRVRCGSRENPDRFTDNRAPKAQQSRGVRKMPPGNFFQF